MDDWTRRNVMEWKRFSFCSNRTAKEDPSANQKNSPTWTRIVVIQIGQDPQGQQIGEVFVDGMPFRNWNGTGEPNNVAQTEHGIHLLGTHFPER